MIKTIVLSLILIILTCGTGVEINPECVLKHTAEMVRLESSSSPKDKGFVNLSWTWVWDTPRGDGVIIERKIDADFDSIGYVTPIEAAMTFFDTSAVLTPNVEVSYSLGFLDGKKITPFDTTTFTIPPAQHIIQPDTEFIDTSLIHSDSLDIIFGRLQGFDTTDVVIFRTSFTDIDSIIYTPIDDILNALLDTVVSAKTTDTIIRVDVASIDTLAIYMIKITSSAVPILTYITDTSIGLRAFMRLPFP